MRLRQVQLVGLIENPDPVVYLTEHIPGMKEAKKVPTRELDAFEKRALNSLRAPDFLKVERHGKELRMLGPIYAGERCSTCHEQQGQLLGAFTYTFVLE